MNKSYYKLGIAIGINAVIMFFLTFVLISSAEHFYFNINRFYMALMMAAPMIIIMLLLMGGMYQNKTLNTVLSIISALAFILVFWLARNQIPVGDTQFLKSMIPHHSSAILMCEQAKITDPQIIALCQQIIKSQKDEIAQMQQILMRR